MASGIRVRGITIDIRADISGLVDSFKSVDGQVRRLQNNLGALTNYLNKDNSWKGLTNQFQGIRLEQQLMQTETERLNEKLKLERDALWSLNSADPTPEIIEKQQALQTQIILDQAELNNLQQKMKEFGSVAKQELLAVSDAFKGTGAKVTAFGDSLVSKGRSMSMYVTAPIVAAGTAAVKSSMDFESAMDKVQSVTLDATADDMERLSAAVLDLSGKSKYSASEAAEALYYMGLAGWNTEEMLSALPQVLAVATAGEMDLGRASDIVTDYFTAFGEGAGTVEHMVDVMARTMVSANTDIDQLGDAFKYVAPVAGAMGYSIEDVSFALGLMANNGIKASQAGTSLRQFMQRLVKPTAEVQNAMDALGITVANSDGSMKSFREVMDDLRVALGGVFDPTGEAAQQISLLNQQLEEGEISEEDYADALEDVIDGAEGVTGAEKAKNAAILAGVRGMSGLLAIVNATEQDYTDLSAAIEGTTTAQDIANIMLDNTAGQTEILKHSIQNLGISFGEQLIPHVQSGINWLQGLVNKFSELDDGTKETIVRIAGIAAAIGPLLVVGGTLIKSIGSIISGVGSIIGLVATHPILAAVTLLAAGIGTLILVHKEHEREIEAERQATYGLTEDQQALIDKINASAEAYKNQQAARDEVNYGIEAEYGYLTDLRDELGRLVDEHGKVKEGYEDRVDFILNELNEALGTEMTQNDGLIEDYQLMQSEITNLIEKKRQEMILEAGQERYVEATKNQRQAYEDYTDAVDALNAAKEKTAEAQKAVNDYESKYKGYSSDAKKAILAEDKAYQELTADLAVAKETQDTLQSTMEDSLEVYQQTQRDIENYGDALQAVASGDTEAARQAIDMLLYDFRKFDNSTEQQLKDQVQRYQTMYERAQRDVAAGVAGVSQATVDGYAEMTRLAQAELDKFNGAVEKSGQQAVKTAGEQGKQIGQAEAKGLNSVDMSGPGSEHIKQYTGAIKSGASTSYDAAKAAAERSKTGFKAVSMTGPGSEFVNEFVEGIRAQKSNANKAGKEAAESAKSGADSVSGHDSGANWVKGVVKGIKDNIYTIEEAANEAAQAGKRGFEKPMAIKSPSRVMMESGKNFDLGIAMGIRDNADTVVSEAERLATETATAMQYNTTSPSYGLNGGSSSSNTWNLGGMNININQQPGQDAQELADAVMDRIYAEVHQRQAVYGV